MVQGGASLSRLERDRLRMALLEEAHIVCTTLAFSGSGLFLRLTRKFDVVVIDEAAQVGPRQESVHGKNVPEKKKVVVVLGEVVQTALFLMSHQRYAAGG